MAKNWKAAAQAIAPDIPPDAIERIEKPMDSLEDSFRPLVTQVKLESEPSYVQLLAREKDA